MLKVGASSSFKRDLKHAEKQNRDLRLLDEVVLKIANREGLDAKHRDHALSGFWQGHRECHIRSDWLLIYKIEDGYLTLVRTGSHSLLFGK